MQNIGSIPAYECLSLWRKHCFNMELMERAKQFTKYYKDQTVPQNCITASTEATYWAELSHCSCSPYLHRKTHAEILKENSKQIVRKKHYVLNIMD